MFTLLLALGGALVVFGAVVLLRYSDRPGASIKWQGAEVSSSGAGLPLIILGIGCIVFAILRRPAAPVPALSPPAPTVAAVGDSAGCAGIRALPAGRVDTVEVGMREVELIDPSQPLDPPFGVVLTDGGRPVGALRFRRYRGPSYDADLYKIEAAVDAACAPLAEGTLRNVSRGGDPRALKNWDTVRVRLGGREYDLRIGGEGNIGVNLTRAG